MSEPSDQLVATEVKCVESRKLWLVPSERWRIYLTDETEPRPVAYCPDCAERRVRVAGDARAMYGSPYKPGRRSRTTQNSRTPDI